jgi:hypothetical protein
MVGAPFGVALLVTVIVPVGVGLPVIVLQAASTGIRKSITRRLVPIHMRLVDGEAVCIMMYPLISQDIHFRRGL